MKLCFCLQRSEIQWKRIIAKMGITEWTKFFLFQLCSGIILKLLEVTVAQSPLSVAERTKSYYGSLGHSFQILYPYWSHSVKGKILWHKKQSHSRQHTIRLYLDYLTWIWSHVISGAFNFIIVLICDFSSTFEGLLLHSYFKISIFLQSTCFYSFLFC